MRYKTSWIRIGNLQGRCCQRNTGQAGRPGRPQSHAQSLRPASRARKWTTSTVIETKAVDSVCARAQINGIHLLPSAFIGKCGPTIDRIDELSE
ncbi:BQ5605_C007g04456 [Microbotryum silenes-dioicae]|uniref:BQ5605_C007g04456 protein n=1 Tax=Microbotryum silenes-dioicae TaxID=796604 RepID=A0A2X0MA15_9BASI|nr:BQ5605_C007g04456 [Microbotryum silenes-dioicae]